MSIQQRINDFDYATASTHDLAVLLEQVFMYHDARSRDGGPILVAQGVLKRYEEAVRTKAAPDLHASVNTGLRTLRENLVQFETSLRQMERGSGQART